MQMQLKVVLLVGLLVAAVAGLITARTSQQAREEKTAMFAANAEAQLAPVRRLVQAKLDLAKEQLIQFTRRKESGGAAAGAFGAFDVVALQFDSGNGRWDSKWLEKRSEAPQERFAGRRERTILASLPYNKVRDGSVQWIWRLDNKEGAMFILMVPVQVEAPQPAAATTLPESPTADRPAPTRRGIVVGIFAGNPLAVVTEDFVSTANIVYVADDSGYVASHTRKSYTGSNFSEDDVVKEIKSSAGRTSRAGTYENLDGEKIYGRWERVEGSNLYAIISTPVQAVVGASSGMTKTMTLLTIGGTILAMLLAFAATRFLLPTTPGGITDSSPIVFQDFDEDDSVKPAGLTPPKISGGPPPLPQLPKAPPAPASQIPAFSAPAAVSNFTSSSANSNVAPSEEAFRVMAQGLSKELRKPLAALLGHVQLLRGKTSGETAHHSESIESEARYLRDVVDALSGISGDEKLDIKPTSLSEIAAIAAANLEKELTLAKVEVKLETDKAPMVDGSPVHLQKSIEALCRQAIESMRTRPEAELRIRVYDLQDGKVRLQIRDAGIGIDREQADRYFEPFYQPYEGAPSLGMGLAMANAIFERHGAAPVVASEPGIGTIVTVDFPVSATKTEVASAPNLTPPPAMPIVEEAKMFQTSTGISFESNSKPDIPVAPPIPKFAPMVPPPLDDVPQFEISEADALSPSELPSLELPSLEPLEPTSSGFTLGGREPVVEKAGPKLPPPPPVEGLSSIAFDLKLVDAVTGTFGDRTVVESEGHFSENLPPMDLSRTAPPSESMREIELPKLDLGPLEDLASTDDDEKDAFSSVVLKSEKTDAGTAVNFGDLSANTQTQAAALSSDTSVGAPANQTSAPGEFKVKIRRPKKG